MMNKEEIKILVNHLVDIQMKIQQISENTVPTWQKNLQAFTPLIAAIIAGCFTFWISWYVFHLNKKKEETLKIDNDEKTNFNYYKIVYGKIIGQNTNMFLLINKLNVSMIESKYYSCLWQLEKEVSKKNQILEKQNESNSVFKEIEKQYYEAINIYTNAIGEYYYSKSNSKIYTLLTNYVETAIFPKYEKEFTYQLNANELNELKNIQITELNIYLKGNITPRMKNISDCILEETKINSGK